MNNIQTAPELMHQIVLILDDDLMITDGLAAGLERRGRTLVTCNDLESGEMVVDWLKPSLVVSDLRLTGPFNFEGLDFINFAKRRSPGSRVIVMTGDAPDALQLEAADRGAVAFLQKPFELRELDALIDLMATPTRAGSAVWPSVIRMPLLDDMLKSPALYPVFQPIFELKTGTPIGYEALSRYRSEAPFRNPEVLFRYAAKKNRLPDLEAACMSRSLRQGASLAFGKSLFLNVHPSVFGSSLDVPAFIQQEAAIAGVPLDSIVLEITEQGTLEEGMKALNVIERLRQLGVRFALDDVGIAYSHLGSISKIQPSFLKVSHHFGCGFEVDPTKLKIVRNILSLAKDFGCELIVEGIESAATAAAAVELGISYGQGYHFAEPREAASAINSGAAY